MEGKVALDYRKFCDLENYLFTEVGPGFVKTGKLSPFDFYVIIIWKASRAKTRVRKRLNRMTGGFSGAVDSIAASLNGSVGQKERLQILMNDWGFRLPMASAILTVLYPMDFTVYDVRVCDQLGAFHKLSHRKFSERLWAEYQQFSRAVGTAAPTGLSLRSKDHYLWGRSFYQSVQREIRG